MSTVNPPLMYQSRAYPSSEAKIQVKVDFITRSPPELVRLIFTNLPKQHAQRYMAVSKQWRLHIINTTGYWESISIRNKKRAWNFGHYHIFGLM